MAVVSVYGTVTGMALTTSLLLGLGIYLSLGMRWRVRVSTMTVGYVSTGNEAFFIY